MNGVLDEDYYRLILIVKMAILLKAVSSAKKLKIKRRRGAKNEEFIRLII